MINMKRWLGVTILTALTVLTSGSAAEQAPPPFSIDATAASPAPETGFLNVGGVSPSGHRISVDSRSLSLDGKPWLPVMGEFHFSRYPEKYWQEELLKMKAGGVQVVATYIFWIHHEEIEGQFDWSGQRDLRHFIELCHQDGLYVYLRIGPWDHGEARNGGFPDWLVNKKIPLRRNDPEYLKYVGRFYDQIGSQIKGQLWQDGGPIVGVQLENEYGETGPGRGAEHLSELKRLAIVAGINPPLFSITGWPGHDYPVHEVIPVSGEYPDDFWTSLKTDSPPNPAYLFSADREHGQGAMALADPAGKIDLRHYPYFAAEQGGGMETSYHRRPWMQPDDIAAVTLTALGSGVNLYGYYMFQGGANPAGKLTTLQESIATGYPNDLPVLSYDFQAPLGEYGQERESFRKVKNLHLFLQSFGSGLAMMNPYSPDRTPKSAADASLARVMLRADGDRGFLFVNNYVRKLEMPERHAFQVKIKMPSGIVELPRTPVDLPANSYFIWPVNLDLSGAGTLEYSTAQLLSRLDNQTETTYFFFSIPGLRSEFAFDAANVASVVAASGSVTLAGGSILVENPEAGKETVLQVTGKNGRRARILLLSEKQAEQFWRVSLGDEDTALLSPAELFADNDGVHLRSVDPARIAASIFMPDGQDNGTHPLWREWADKVETRKIDYEWNSGQQAGSGSDIRIASHVEGRDGPMPLAPDAADFAQAAVWSLKIPAQSMSGLSDIFLRIRYAGDVARLSLDGRLLDDDFYNGRTWEIGLKRFLPDSFGKKLEVSVLPLPRTAPIYLDARAWQPMNAEGQTAKVLGVELVPEYEATLKLPKLQDEQHVNPASTSHLTAQPKASALSR
jgi:hypothetical protein